MPLISPPPPSPFLIYPLSSSLPDCLHLSNYAKEDGGGGQQQQGEKGGKWGRKEK